jgi:NAD(P)-dependent dehydrogenase (short-subunit alcohol dehydrogenase family)
MASQDLNTGTGRDVTNDQYTRRDPTRQYGVPETGGREIEHPGRTAEMAARPDHGELTYRGSDRLPGKKAVITGGDSGIGRAVAIAFAREGADVLITHLEAEQEDAADTARLIQDAGRQAVTVAGDLTDQAHCRAVVDRAVAEFGRVDVLVNNAAYQMSSSGGIEDISTEQLDRVMRTNLYAMFWLTQAALPHMRAGASIINTSSIQAYQPSPHLLDYAMTKAAIANFTKSLGEQLVERGIRVNAVAPGPIWTPLIPATMDGERLPSFGKDTPMGRPGQPSELAPAYVFFASQESSYITAEVLGVTGGKPIS